jgi:hypothetical protein
MWLNNSKALIDVGLPKPFGPHVMLTCNIDAGYKDLIFVVLGFGFALV